MARLTPAALERLIVDGAIEKAKESVARGARVAPDALARYCGGNAATARALIEAGADVAARGGITLQRAVAARNEPMVEMLLEYQKDTTYNWRGAAFEAGGAGNARIANLLLQASEHDKRTIGAMLEGAAGAGHASLVAALLDLAARRRAADESAPALAAAARGGHVEVLRMLIKMPLFTTYHVERAIAATAGQGSSEVLILLLGAGVDEISVSEVLFEAVEREMVAVLCEIRYRYGPQFEKEKDVVLEQAVAYNALDAARFLVANGARVSTACPDVGIVDLAERGRGEMLALVLGAVKEGERFAQGSLDAALVRALAKGHRNCAETLAAHGAAIEPARAFAIAKRDVDAAAILAPRGVAPDAAGRRLSLEALEVFEAARPPAPDRPDVAAIIHAARAVGEAAASIGRAEGVRRLRAVRDVFAGYAQVYALAGQADGGLAERLLGEFFDYIRMFDEIIAACEAGSLPAETQAQIDANAAALFAPTGPAGAQIDAMLAEIKQIFAASADAPKSAEEVLAAARAAHEAGDTAALKRILGIHATDNPVI